MFKESSWKKGNSGRIKTMLQGICKVRCGTWNKARLRLWEMEALTSQKQLPFHPMFRRTKSVKASHLILNDLSGSNIFHHVLRHQASKQKVSLSPSSIHGILPEVWHRATQTVFRNRWVTGRNGNNNVRTKASPSTKENRQTRTRR